MFYFLIASYLLGSISSAILICKIAGLPDPRTKGSQNPGATNVLRIGGKKIAALVLFLDGLKGALPVILAHYFGLSLFESTIILLCAFLGHVFPIFYGMFKGDVDEKLSLISVIIGLIFGLLLFPNQTFDKSILIGGLFPTEAFPIWISTALLFWSFVLASLEARTR